MINKIKEDINKNINMTIKMFTPMKLSLYTILLYFSITFFLPYIIYGISKVTNIGWYVNIGKSTFEQLNNLNINNKSVIGLFLLIFPHNLRIATILMFLAPFIVVYLGYIAYTAIVSSAVIYYISNANPKLFGLYGVSLVPHGLFELTGISFIVYSGLYLYRKELKLFVKCYLVGAIILAIAGLIESLSIALT